MIHRFLAAEFYGTDMSIWPSDDVDILDLDDLERSGPRQQRQPRQSQSAPPPSGGTWTDPRFLVPLLLFLVAVFVIGLAFRSNSVADNNADLLEQESAVIETSELAQRVNDAEVRAGFNNLEISEQDGVVVIGGTVPDEFVAASVGAVARSVEGTLRVDNRVVVAGGTGLGTATTTPVVQAGGAGLTEQLQGLDQITFETSSAALTPEGAAVVDAAAALLSRVNGVQIEVHGHTDSDGDEALNQVLSQERADAVVAALGQRGVDTTFLTAVGFGESNPIEPNITAEGRATNRRIEFVQR